MNSNLGRMRDLPTLAAGSALRDRIAAEGLTPPTEIIHDGELHRFSSNGNYGDDSGWPGLQGSGARSDRGGA